MRSVVILAAAWAAGCAEPMDGGVCGDAAFWAARTAEWPAGVMYVGEHPMERDEAVARLERAPSTPRDALVQALILAELNLAFDGDPGLLPLVYEGHALVADEVAADGDALALADALSPARVCHPR